jgi:hypothetical protein
MQTDELIASLTNRLEQVRPIAPPPLRAGAMIVIATALIAVLAAMRGMRVDFAAQMHDPAFMVQIAGAWLTGAAATLAAFEISLPDRSARWSILPLPAILLWLTGFAVGCLGHWIAIPPDAPVMEDSRRCLQTIGMASLPLAIVLWLMLRTARPLRLGGTAWLASLAIAGFADTAHLLIHVVQASLLVLVINLIPSAVIILLGSVAGRSVMTAGNGTL